MSWELKIEDKRIWKTRGLNEDRDSLLLLLDVTAACSPVHGRRAVPEQVAADAVVGRLHPPTAHRHAPHLGQGECVRVTEGARGQPSLQEHLWLCWAVAAAGGNAL